MKLCPLIARRSGGVAAGMGVEVGGEEKREIVWQRGEGAD